MNEGIFKVVFYGVLTISACVFIFAVASAVVNCSGNVSGSSARDANAEAREWARNMGLDVQGVSCTGIDTDGDGYVSCSVSSKGPNGTQVHAIECARAFSWNKGCRVARVIQVNPQ